MISRAGSKKRSIGLTPLAAALVLMLSSCQSSPGDADGTAPGDWPNFGRTGAEQHYSPLEEIDGKTVDRLQLAWFADFDPGYTASSPVAAEGKIFTTSGHSLIRAFDAVTGKELWTYDAKTREIAQTPLHIGWGNKGLSYYKGRIFIGTTDGRVIALDAGSGKVAWEQRQYDLSEMRNNNGPPRVFDGKVIVGHGGADITPLRGYVTAYDAMTGKQVWRFYSVPGDEGTQANRKAEEVMRKTWPSGWKNPDGSRRGGGGTAWNAFSYDAELDLIYIGVGNGYPYNQDLRSPGGGDNLFLASIVAVKADTGEYAWHYQVCPGEQWDCTATQDMTIATVEIDGKPRKVLMQAPKNGFLYVLDAATGQFISAEKIGRVTWAEKIDAKGRPVENPGIRYQGARKLFEMWPGPQGAHNWLPQAYSPKTGLLYIPVIENGALIGPAELGGSAINNGLGVTLVPDAFPTQIKGYLKAWNPVTQKAAWIKELPWAWVGGVMATAGDLVFQGRIDSQFVAYDAASGKQVWSYPTQAPVVAAPISFQAGGKQYIAVMTGNGSSGAGIQSSMVRGYDTDYRLPRRLLVFALDGKARLPAMAQSGRQALNDPGFAPDPAVTAKGGMGFAATGCMVCHGLNAISGGAAPDLRYSQAILDAATFKAIVHGALKPNGMPAYPQLDEATVESIRHYLRSRAIGAPREDEAARSGKVHGTAPRSQPVSGM